MTLGKAGGTRTTRLTPSRCSQCGAENDAATSISGDIPTDGDRAVCAYCSGVSVYVSSPFGLVLRPATAEEAEDPAVDNLQVLLAATRLRRHGRRW